MDLELRLTEVKENLKKSLAGGVLGPPTESKPPRKVPGCFISYYITNNCLNFRPCFIVFLEFLPVNRYSQLCPGPDQ